jgi:hypothetical protein
MSDNPPLGTINLPTVTHADSLCSQLDPLRRVHADRIALASKCVWNRATPEFTEDQGKKASASSGSTARFAMELSSRYSASGLRGLEVLSEDARLAFCRGWRDTAEGSRDGVLVLLRPRSNRHRPRSTRPAGHREIPRLPQSGVRTRPLMVNRADPLALASAFPGL